MSKQPNLIYVMADQLRHQSLGYTGDALAQTPFLDAFAAQSIDMCNAVSGHPVCAPYRASLFTGKYTPSTGMVINEIRLATNHRCFGHVLNESGYDTSYIGKWHLYANQVGNHYDAKNSFVPKGSDRLGFDDFFAAYNFHHEYYGAAAYYHLDTPEKIYCNGYEPDVQTDMAIERLKFHKSQDKPFALFLSLGTPHDPWEPWNVPGEYYERFNDTNFALPSNYKPDNDPYGDRWARLNENQRNELTDWMRCYYAMTANLNDNFGRLLQTVSSLELDNDTIIVFTSDHGEMFGAQGRRGKNIFYEEAVRVPFLIRQPGGVAAGTKNDACLNAPDIMPTLLGLMNLPCPNEAEGVDVFANPPTGTLMMGTGATAIYQDGHEWRAWRTRQFTYATYLVDGATFLFDNINDPLQKVNLSGNSKYAQVEAEMKKNMASEMHRIGDGFHPCSYYEKNRIADRIIQP
ncbi:MAG: sulfatase [Defluviitaleaceae bacterium]|nr:sulfatase [Defluviitaleaceae bacterium]